MREIRVHKLAQPDLDRMSKSGNARLLKRAFQKMEILAGLDKPIDYPNVVHLGRDAPGWFRYKDGDVRIIFRFVINGAGITEIEIIEVILVALRNEKTYGRELKRRYRIIEEK